MSDEAETLLDDMRALGLDEAEVDFVVAFCRPDINYNATSAYLEAYPTENRGTARAAATRKMQKQNIRKAIELFRKTRVLKNESLVSKVISEMELMAFTSPLAQLITIKGKARSVDGVLDLIGNTIVVNNLEEVPAHVLNCVKSIKQTKIGIAVEFYDRARFMELLGRSLGMFTENLNVTEESYESFLKRLSQREREASAPPKE